ncbi:hypothetical protein ILUMI_05847 [Ignelater luminosus]|uniref:Uncharacterized protein n=1 Tax=Ignelater luminosus TaxID=2038154 RepID=A0A8K0D6Y3_IGNLU|nr:hypothetical protein ILUMI_05847 [Ignelater luminosus]
MTTEFAMPPISTIPSEDLDDNDVAFKVLNQDNLPISIVGESIFKPFGRDSLKQKPNGIVYPTRRIIGNLEDNKQKAFTRSNGYISSQNAQALNKDVSASHGNLNHCNSAAKGRNETNKVKTLDTSFTKALDAKLRKLQKEEKQQTTTSVKTTKLETPRKPFITTVKKGHFLDPPPEIASLLGYKVEPQIPKENKNLYSFASKPRVLNKVSNNAHKSRCETAAKAAAVVASTVIGVHHFVQNLKDVNSNITKPHG